MFRFRNNVSGFALAALLLARPGLALNPARTLTQYAHRIWGQEEGLFQPTIYAITQTHDGFMWLGTQDSLIRFDGIHFHEFEDQGRPALNRSLIRALLEDNHRNLWVASIGDGVLRIGPDGALKHYTTREGLPSNTTFCLASGSDHAIWACTNQGLARIKDDRVSVLGTADGLPSNQVRSTCEANDGTRWVAGLDFGLARWNGSRFTAYSNADLPLNQTVTALLCDGAGSVWAGNSFGLTQIRSDKVRHFSARDGLPDNDVSSLAESPDGAIWIGTKEGISRIREGAFSVYRTRYGLSHSVVLSLYFDREGSLWAGTKDGLDQFTDGQVTPYTTSEGLVSNDVGPVLEDDAGRLWIGTLGYGLNRMDGNRFRAYTTRDGLVSNMVLSLARDQHEGLWVGTDKGLNRIVRNKVVATYTTANGLSGAQINAISISEHGTVWVGTDRGLDRFDGSRFRPAPASESAPSAVLALAPSQGHGLFVSRDNLAVDCVMPRENVRCPLDINHPLDAYFVDNVHDTVWMGTLGSGLLRWKNGTITHIRIRDGLYDNRIYSILDDGKGNFWMASSKGIFRVRRQDLEDLTDGKIQAFQSLPFSTGQLHFECRAGVQPAASRTADGRLWFSTNNGLVVVDPDHLVNNQVAPPVSVTAVLVSGNRVDTRDGIELKPFERNLEIRYAGLSFISPENVSFRYRLDGFERNWIDAGYRREAFFTNLPPGRFYFRVTARNADGIWSREPAVLAITIQPRIYQRWWFWPGLTILVALSVLAAYRARIRRLRRNFALVLAERARIARELHDTLLQGLSGITMQMQALWTILPASRERTALQEIISDAGQCAREARRSLWGLRALEPGHGEFSDELAKLARQAVEGTGISLVLHVEAVSLSGFPDLQYQLLRMARESITNVIRHARASVLEIRLSLDSSYLRLTIRDNGTGISPESESVSDGHFGVVGLHERAAEIGAHLEFKSEPGIGTVVSISLPFPPRSNRLESNLQPDVEHHLS
ncbi:MAG TPA: two-component regulator propeller domain-containing protein [Terriglobales bacterium]